MNKQNYLYGVIGLLLGIIIGYIGTDQINKSVPPTQIAFSETGNESLPDNRPPTGAEAAAGNGGPQADVSNAVEKARKEPDNVQAQLQAAEMFRQIGRAEGAIEFLESAAKAKPKDANLLVTLGDTYFDLRRFADAEKWYQAALKEAPGNPTVWMDLGNSYYLRSPRDLEKAIAAYRSALKVDPRHEKSLQNLTRALIDKGDRSGAKETLAQLEKVNAANSSISEYRAELP
jgi:tetratricopeptide (TPR) repeat protein